jgi:periplasmic copper chaperone A
VPGPLTTLAGTDRAVGTTLLVVTALRTPRPTRRLARRAAGAAVALVAVIAPATMAAAHTETDFVAVPAGSTATVTFEPEHGCGDSPTIDMKVQAPVADATALELAGWTASATPNGEGNTVLEWSGGSQPAHEPGAFQVQFQVPQAVGTLLAFPAVQTCANGANEAWIDTEPGAESPAPQLLVLAAGSAPAASLDDIPAGTPGRDQLAALAESDVDDDTGAATASSSPAAATSAPTATTDAAGTSAPATATATTPAATGAPATTSAPTTTAAATSDSGSSTGWIVGIVVAVVIVGAVAAVVLARRRRTPPPPSPEEPAV